MSEEIVEERIKFVADDNLLRQVITDQAGEWKKGILELIQNAYDSLVMKGKVTPQTSIDITASTDEDGVSKLVVEDNGCGWGDSKEEVIRNMQIFGNSIKKELENTIGEKGMGRGQAFAMIYDMSREEFIGDIVIETRGWRIYDIQLSDLSFSIEKAKKVGDEPVKYAGTRWTITSSYRQFNEDEIYEYIEENIMIPVTIKLNGSAISKKTKGKRFETDLATYIIVQGKGGFQVYDRGLKVKFEKLGGIGGIIITKIPLKLNFARNDVLSSDPHYDEIIAKGYECVADYIEDSRGAFNDAKRVAMKGLIAKDSSYIWQFEHEQIVKTAQGKFITPYDIMDRKVYIAEEGNRLADDICQMGGIVLADGYGEMARKYNAVTERLEDSTDSIVERAKRNRYRVYGDDDLPITDRMRECMGWLRELDCGRQLYFGKHNSWVAWTNGRSEIWFNIKHFKKWCKAKTKAGFYLKALPTFAHEMAHTDDNRETDFHGYGFEREHVECMQEYMRRASSILDKGNN